MLCSVCNEKFIWSDDVIEVDDTVYHEHCVQLYPTGYAVFDGDDYIGEISDTGQSALEIIEEFWEEREWED